MKLYFYTNKNIMFDFLGRNIIGPDTIVKDIKQYRTIGTALDHFLFVTHKKLDKKSREKGIKEPVFVYPVTLELSDINANDGQAVLLSIGEKGCEYELAPLNEYDTEKNIGAYLIGEIPLSRVEKIYFDTIDDQDMFYRPSPDYWFPVNKCALLPEGFNEELVTETDEKKLIAACGLDLDRIKREFRHREKERAALLNFINGTRRWSFDKYNFNIDYSLQQLFGLKDEDISSYLPHYTEMRRREESEYISLVGEDFKQKTSFNQIIYDHIRNTFKNQTGNTTRTAEKIWVILDTLCGKITAECKSEMEKTIIRQSFYEIKKLISDSSDKGPEEIMAQIPEPIDVLKALLLVVKNPDNYSLFLEALNAYHADNLTRRRAAVLWGTLNGLYGMPGEDFNKDNQKLWHFIEAFVYSREDGIRSTLAVGLPEAVLLEGEVFGITLKEERIVTAADVRNYILNSPKDRFTDSFYKKLLEAAETEAGSKKKAENRGYAYSTASIALPEIRKGDKLDSNIRKTLEQLLKDCRTAVPNREKLYKDYVENADKFDFVFSMDQEFWRKVFLTVLEKKKNAQL